MRLRLVPSVGMTLPVPIRARPSRRGSQHSGVVLLTLAAGPMALWSAIGVRFGDRRGDTLGVADRCGQEPHPVA